MRLQRLYPPGGWDPDALREARADLERQQNAVKGRTPTDAERSAIAEARFLVKKLTPPVVGITLLDTGATPNQNFSENLIDQGTKEGWLELTDDGRIIIHSQVDEPPKLTTEAVAELDRLRKAMGGRPATDSEQAAIDAARKKKADAAGQPGQRVHVGDYVFSVKRGPGTYCCHCWQEFLDHNPQADDDGLTEARRHVLDAHPGAVSPDPNNPSGYTTIHHYETVLVGAPKGGK